MARQRNIVASVATYLQNPDGSNGQICDRATFESFGVETPEVIEMRKPLLDVGAAWNAGDVDTDVVIAAPAVDVPAPAIQSGAEVAAPAATK